MKPLAGAGRWRRGGWRSGGVRRFGWNEDHDAGGCRYSGFLPMDEAALVNAAIDRIAESAGPNPETGFWDPMRMRRADALSELGGQRIAADPGPDPTAVVVHVDADVIDGMTDGNGYLDGVALGRDSVLRLLCDTTIVHEGGWTIAGSADGELTFRSPWGRTLRSRPKPLRPEVRTRIEGATGVPLGE